LERIWQKYKVIILASLALVIVVLLVGAMLLTTSSSKTKQIEELLSLGEKYLLELDYENAIVTFQKVISIEPRNAASYKGLAKAYVGMGDIEKAIAALEEGYRQTNDPELRDWLADLRDDEIVWIDPVFEQVIRNGIKKPVGGIRRSELDYIVRLEIWGSQHTYINGYDQFGNILLEDDPWYLEDFEGSDDEAQITSLADVKNLRNLSYLGIMYNEIEDLTPLTNLHQLDKLWLFVNQIQDLSPLANLYGLLGLDLGSNNISDIGPLVNLINLENLAIDDNHISSIEAVRSMHKLTHFLAVGNTIADISPLAGLTQLTELELSENSITDVSPLAGLINLEILSLEDNPTEDLSPLDKFPEGVVSFQVSTELEGIHK